ncbi:MAG: SNF2-related protein [Desulfobacteraceae bacterium]|nr:SNF2-related protein [Desulfobacteraceae bacterium]
MTTPYHAKYFAHEMTRIGSDGIDRLGRALFDACVDLNPHQIEAALFALRSPISKGVLLADEVGLGKTIEAGIVLCQYWAERRRKILVITPASLRKQWEQELAEKFNLPAKVIDAKTYRNDQKNGNPNPFFADSLVICSMHYASRKAEEIKTIAWDLVVIDEAHKLKNAYRQSNRIGKNIRWAISDFRKILLTATPLQNSLLELYGLSTIIDERLFGDLPSFRTQYLKMGGDLNGLQKRLQSFCKRTLRRQVLEYIQYTERKLITRPFKPSEQEHKLYEAISAYLQREDTYALPKGQRHLIILLVRKLLASSPQAVAGTLEIMRNRLIRLRNDTKERQSAFEQLIIADDIEEDLLDELLEDEEDLMSDNNSHLGLIENEDDSEPEQESEPKPEPKLKIDIKELDAEIEELNHYIRWAQGIGVDTKTRSLLTALKIGFSKMSEMGASKKVVIFTESCRTQAFLKEYLHNNGYPGKVITFNGTNRDPNSNEIYNLWLKKNVDTGYISGSRAIDVRTAIIDQFKEDAQILIATEAAAEGINLQFCSLVINFDLPWNPQRIEQRIGRCHRYGQKFDVVVINFLNQRNEADQRVYELLEHKFTLFDGVFGVSDDVLGSIESGVDFERRILDIYQQCRSREEIEKAFVGLQKELDEQIRNKMSDTRQILMEHFDEDVHERLKVNLSGAQDRLDRIGRMFWTITRFILDSHALFIDSDLAFNLNDPPNTEFRSGKYYMISKQRDNIAGEFLYRLSHPLGEYVITQATDMHCPPAEIMFDISSHPVRISLVEQLKGKCGWLYLQHLCIDSFDREEYLLFSAFDDDGKNIDQETCEKLFNCSGIVRTDINPINNSNARLLAEAKRHAQATIARSLETNSLHFNEACIQLDKWAEDMEIATQKLLDDTKRQIRDIQRRSRQAPTLEEQHQFQEEIAKLERRKRRLRERIFDIEDEIAEKRDQLVQALENRMQQKTTSTELFTIRWKVV